MHGDGRMTYFAYLTHIGRLPNYIKALIDRYNIRMYYDIGDVSETVPSSDRNTEKPSANFLVNFNTNNNDDDVESVQSPPAQMPAGGTETSPPSSTKVLKLKVPSQTRRLSKLGRRSSTDKTKTTVESTLPSDSQPTDTASSAESSMPTVDDPHLQTPDTCIALDDEQKSKDCDEQTDKYEEGNYCGRTKNAIATLQVM